MSKKNDKKAKIAKSNQSVNNTLRLLTVGCLAEFYLLLAYNFFVNGPVKWVVALSRVFGVLRYAALVLAVVCAVLIYLWKNEAKKRAAAIYGVIACVFLSVTSFLMIAFYPSATEMLCVAVPLLMLYGVVFLLYPRDFFGAATALGLSFLDLWLIRRYFMGHPNGVKILTVVGIVILAAVCVLVVLVKKNGGRWISKTHNVKIFSRSANYNLLYASFALAALAPVAALVELTVAYYAMWVLGAALFALAVYYTVKQV